LIDKRIAHDYVGLCELWDGVDSLLIEDELTNSLAILRDYLPPSASPLNIGLSGAWYNPVTNLVKQIRPQIPADLSSAMRRTGESGDCARNQDRFRPISALTIGS